MSNNYTELFKIWQEASSKNLRQFQQWRENWELGQYMSPKCSSMTLKRDLAFFGYLARQAPTSGQCVSIWDSFLESEDIWKSSEESVPVSSQKTSTRSQCMTFSTLNGDTRNLKMKNIWGGSFCLWRFCSPSLSESWSRTAPWMQSAMEQSSWTLECWGTTQALKSTKKWFWLLQRERQWRLELHWWRLPRSLRWTTEWWRRSKEWLWTGTLTLGSGD